MWAEGLLCGQSVKYELGNCPIYSHVDKREKCVSVYKMGNNIHQKSTNQFIEYHFLINVGRRNNIHLQTIFSGKQYPLAQALFYHQPRKNIFGSQTLKYLIFCTTVQFKCRCLIPETHHQYGSIVEVEFSNIQTRSQIIQARFHCGDQKEVIDSCLILDLVHCSGSSFGRRRSRRRRHGEEALGQEEKAVERLSLYVEWRQRLGITMRLE